MVVKHQSKGHRQECSSPRRWTLTASAAGTLIEKKEVRHFELIHILLRFIPLVYQEVTLEVEVALLEKKKLYIYTHSSWTEFHLASNLELWRRPWLRYSGFVMWSWTCSVSMVVHSIKFTVKLCQDFFVLISTQHSIHKYTKTKKALCFLSFYLSPLGHLVGWSLMNLED